MSWIIPAVTAGAQILQGMMQGDAASRASGAQTALLGRQYDEMRQLLQPYTQAGVAALQQQQALAGLGTPEQQQAAIAGIEGSPQFQALLEQGEQGILSRASATGGLRGGNVQGALAQFRPGLLSDLINQQYSRLGGLSQMGQASAAGQVTAGGSIFPQMGAAQAGGILGQARGFGQMVNAPMAGIGTYYGMTGKMPWDNGSGKVLSSSPSPTYYPGEF